ncbi:MAG: hypothetical protein AAF846_28325 [Chloroflexota bacterium]
MQSNRLTYMSLLGIIIVLAIILLGLASQHWYSNQDISLFLGIGYKILVGERPYVDFFEINLPTIMYLNAFVVAIADGIGINRLLMAHLLTWMLIMWSCVSAYRIIGKHTKDGLRWLQVVLPIVLLIISIYVWFRDIYAQRELIFIAMIIPWILIRFLRWESMIDKPYWSYFVIGFIGAIATSIKPYFPIIILLIEGYYLLRLRTLKQLFTPEVYGFAGFTVLYLLYFVLNPAVFLGLVRELQLVSDGYDAYAQVSLLHLLRNNYTILFLAFCVLPFTVWRVKHPLLYFSRITALIGLGGMFIMAIQAKGYTYHWIPLWFGGLTTLMVLFVSLGHVYNQTPDYLKQLSLRLLFIPVVALGLEAQELYTLENSRFNNIYADNVPKPEIIQIADAYTEPETPIYVLAISGKTPQPHLTYFDRYNISSYPMSYPIRMAYADFEEERLNPEFPFPTYIEGFIESIRADLLTRPELIIFDEYTHEFLMAHDILTDDLILDDYAQVTDLNSRQFNDRFTSYLLLDNTPTSETHFQFGEYITLDRWLTSFPNDDQTVTACEAFSLRTIWTTNSDLLTRYSLSATLIDDAGNSVAQMDSQPSETSTFDWIPDAYYQDDRDIVVPCETASGTYSLLLTLYDPLTEDSNLAVVSSDGAGYGAYLWFGDVTVVNNPQSE